MNLQQKPIIPETIVWREELGDVIILNSETEELKLLNPTAAFIWGLCDGEHSVENIVGLMLDTFDVEREQCESDIKDLFKQLEERSLVSWA